MIDCLLESGFTAGVLFTQQTNKQTNSGVTTKETLLSFDTLPSDPERAVGPAQTQSRPSEKYCDSMGVLEIFKPLARDFPLSVQYNKATHTHTFQAVARHTLRPDEHPRTTKTAAAEATG